MESVINKKARFKYGISDTYTAGIVLEGWEVKPILARKINLDNSYVIIKDGEMFLLNMLISPEVHTNKNNSFNKIEVSRTKKLLMKKKEIMKIMGQVKEKGFTLVPTKIFTMNNKIKVEVALAKGKNEYDKRETVKVRDTNKDLARIMKKKSAQ